MIMNTGAKKFKTALFTIIMSVLEFGFDIS